MKHYINLFLSITFIGNLFLPIISQEFFELLGYTNAVFWSIISLTLFFIHLAIVVKKQQAEEEYKQWLNDKITHDQKYADDEIYPYE